MTDVNWSVAADAKGVGMDLFSLNQSQAAKMEQIILTRYHLKK